MTPNRDTGNINRITEIFFLLNFTVEIKTYKIKISKKKKKKS